jgi:hypothetical protein
MLEQIMRPSGAMAGFLGQDNSQMLYTAYRFRNMGGKELHRRTGVGSSRAKGENRPIILQMQTALTEPVAHNNSDLHLFDQPPV